MKAAGIIAALAMTSLLFWQAVDLVVPAICHRTSARAAEICLDQSSIQSFPVEETVTPVTNETEAPPAYVPNDSYFDKQWAFQKIQAREVTSSSPNVLVAILDTGIDQQHEDLVGQVIDGINLADSPTTSDILGHGTHVSGIIAATPDNGIGVAGVASNCRLLNVKVADDSGMVWPSTVAEGIVWAVDNGARIINMSLLVPTPLSTLEEAVDYAWSNGVVLIAAAGNEGSSIPVYPACYPEVIAVAAVDADGRLWTKSNSGDWVDAYAPGVEIFSTLPCNDYGYRSGTSMAAAHVTSVAALTFGAVTDVNGDGLVNDEVTAKLKTVFHSPESRLTPNAKF